MNGDDAPDPLIGSKIGPCRIELRLAAGGMGVVYRARHLQLDQPVAVKILAPSLAADQEYVTRFFREAGAAGQIDHPNVVRVVDVGKHEDKYYLVMEYVEGDTLDRLLDTERRLPLEKATRLIREVAAGLAAAHRAGIIHRDVKPGNIIVSPDGRPHLTDFGLARHTETRKGLTVEGTFLGTPEYASPEQVEGRRLDHRTDLYSLGVTYYQLLSGTLPFLGESPMEIAIKRTKEDARPLENAFPGADPRACGVTRRLLQAEAGQRHQSATDLIRELDAILSGDRGAGAPGKPKTTRASGRPSRSILTKNRVRASLHLALLATSLALAFLSGALAARDGEFLETWGAHDRELGLRMTLLVAAVAAGAAAILVYLKSSLAAARWAAVSALVAIMLIGALGTGTLLSREPGQNTAATLSQSARALAGGMTEPINRLSWGLFVVMVAAVLSYEHQPGSLRVLASRILVLIGFVLAYGFGASKVGLDAPLRKFMEEPELSIPLSIATILGCIFGLLMLTGYNFERGARAFGLLLTVGAMAGVFACAVLISQPQRTGWTTLLQEPFADFGRYFRKTGTLLVVTLAVGIIEESVMAAGVRQGDRVQRKRF
jgi:hypothetical protein